MAEFIYNNTKNISTSYRSFKLNCGYYFQILYKKNVNFKSRSKSAIKLLIELGKVIIIYCKNLYYSQKL